MTGSFIVDATSVSGPYVVTVTGNLLDVGTATFTVTAKIDLFPTVGLVGTNVLITGSGFINPGDTGCAISSTPSGLISSPLCNLVGGIVSGSFAVASGAASGTYTVTVTGTLGDTATASFTVSTVATLFLNPVLGQVGTTVAATGTGYLGTTCTLLATPANLFASSSCSIAAGALTGSFIVAPSASPGTTYTVRSQTNGGAGDTAAANFAVIAGSVNILNLTPSSGPMGTLVTGSAVGFPSDTTCSIISAPQSITSSPSCVVSGGTVSIGFTAACSSPSCGTGIGSYTILAIGNTGSSASGIFTVTGTPVFSLSANPSSLVLSPGGTATVIVTVLATGGFNSAVTLTPILAIRYHGRIQS